MRKDARQLSRDSQETLRKRVVLAVEEKGMLQTEAVKIFDVSLSAITKWVRKYRKSGLTSLEKKRQGRPVETGKLKGWEAAYVVRTITDKCPEQLKMPWILWSREAVRQLIVDKFQIELSISSVSRLLKKWGFTPQKPIYRAYERNPKAIARWMTEEYPKIHRQAKKEKAEICWCDEMGVRSDDQVGRSFGRRGQTPVIAASGKRFKCNMISAITNAGNSRFMVYLEDFGVNVFIDFLRRLIMKAPRKIFLITDNHRVHHARKVHQWLAKHTDKIAIFYLPAYAPELNPDELYNQDVKANTIKRQRPQNAGELKSLLRSYANSVQKKPAKIRNFFDASGLAYIRLAEAA